MLLESLQESLREVTREKEKFAQMEIDLKLMIARLTGEPLSHSSRKEISEGEKEPSREGAERYGKDNINEAAEAIRKAGVALHITEIAAALSTARGRHVDRTTIEPGFNRHVAKVPPGKRRLVKVGPSTFNVPELITEEIVPLPSVEFIG